MDICTSADLKNDLDYFTDGIKSVSEVEHVVCSTSDGQEYHLLKHLGGHALDPCRKTCIPSAIKVH